MSQNRPPEDEPIDADLVQDEVSARGEDADAEEAPPEVPRRVILSQPPRALPTYAGYRPRRKSSPAWPLVFVGGLIVVAAASWAFRAELSSGYDRLAALLFGAGEPEDTSVPILGTEPPKVAERPTRPAPPPETHREPAVEETPLPTFEKVERPPMPEETPPVIPPKERYPGLAYSIIDRKDLTFMRVYQYELKVVVPANYKKDDLLRMALDVVAEERKQGLRHALRFLCFKDKEHIKPEDAFAEIVWAPEGDFLKASMATRLGSDDNEYRVLILKN